MTGLRLSKLASLSSEAIVGLQSTIAPAWSDVASGARVGVAERTLRRLAAEGRLPMSRHRLLGLPDDGLGNATVAISRDGRMLA